MLDLLKRKEKVVGIKQTRKAAEQDKLEAVFIAYDADQRVVGQLKAFCEAKRISVVTTESMKQLGKAAGIDVGAAVVGILKACD
ncbi:MAG: ribosomal L7Ae/L30e/S12e/Gadd45 family protein [Clostridia bacterium]|nr:ribosomal L7Ae/L30e/S12e/Gadd45 family protein [Clostridia bacterium]